MNDVNIHGYANTPSFSVKSPIFFEIASLNIDLKRFKSSLLIKRS